MGKSNQAIQTGENVNSQIQSFEMNVTNSQNNSSLGVVDSNSNSLTISSSEKQIYGNEDLIHRRSNITEIINNTNPSTTIDPEKAIELNAKSIDIKTAGVSPILKSVDNPNGNVDFSTSHYSNGSSTMENMSQQDLVDSSPRLFKNNDNLFDVDVTETDDSDSYSDIDSRSTWAFRDLSDLQSEVRRFQIFTFMSSYKFVLILYSTFVIFQIALWLILGGVEEALFSNSLSHTGERIFLLEGGMLVFDRGCSMSTKMVLIIAGESVIYIIFEIVALILCIRSDRDTWSVKKEAILIIIFQVIAIIAFVVTGLIDEIVTLTDYFIPYGYSLMTFSLVEVFTTVLLPVVYAIVSEYRNLRRMDTEFDSELEQVLRNRKSFNKMLDFARRSYAPESVLCYRDIQRFKKLRANNRRKMAHHIVNSYLTSGSPLELNIDNIIIRKKEFSDRVSNTNEKLPRDMFNQIQDHCLVDMRDIFDRLRSSDKEIYQMIQDWRMKQSKLIN
ncbi:predicted protein [Naegleria gruberi]|uniref:Predicted protein n=1 Tax=Naegleria gruberi TaxID=5762 RepID=D2V5A7_NAEGR|nr:uncharacterized protein NAEGRDRAFT_46825 [Naegleria gruberi]EFC48077.1 predicted protein [Naegleria gruberi]|eukprot:XP_002680821.1 predicted protein [Naegleria gruberi strain NEG-M]